MKEGKYKQEEIGEYGERKGKNSKEKRRFMEDKGKNLYREQSECDEETGATKMYTTEVGALDRMNRKQQGKRTDGREELKHYVRNE